MRFVVAPISRPPHPKGKGRLREGPCNTRSAVVACFEGGRLLALTCCLHRSMLGLRIQGQRTWASFAAGTVRSDLTGCTAPFGQQHLNRRFAPRPLG